MKVLSIKEPYATLICNGKKLIETRSWKTNYRGELYIHASLSKITKDVLNNEEVMRVLDNDSLNYGMIICKCRLVDCVYMDEEFLENIKANHQEYVCGYYSLGRYAWILEDIVPLECKIPVKGKLNLSEFNL